jgi:hypothetical protein
MTQDEIIDMARQAGFKMENSVAIQAAEIFANLVAAKEREACARVCEEEQEYWGWDKVIDAAKIIRARGEA